VICAERILPYFETKYPQDHRPRRAIELFGMESTRLTPTPRCRKNVSGNIGIHSSFHRSEAVAGVE